MNWLTGKPRLFWKGKWCSGINMLVNVFISEVSAKSQTLMMKILLPSHMAMPSIEDRSEYRIERNRVCLH